MKYAPLFLLISLIVSSCKDSALLDKNITIAEHQWDYAHPAEIAVHITDPSRAYRIYLNLRHTPDYQYANVFLLMHLRQPSGKDTTERIELTLAEPDGRWVGRSAGSNYSFQELIKDNYRFADSGQYVFALEQNMRENPLREITDVGIRIEPIE